MTGGSRTYARACRGHIRATSGRFRHQVDQVQAFAQLHAGGVAGRADQVAAPVHVDVKVGPIPALAGGIEQTVGLTLDHD